ncbi:AraC family transcriptional regulator [Actinocrispum wychmicini]|uniref:AraC-like DNA-binding protein n=1 Tax=Actinocrispum wychmicini TaxID=1213861 RepID=A0A4R2JSA0_9PSEU|nr:AraC family transcriptional regulator [Actinocrispum wychmicini]TCO62464.1 AraC-like DNA-binding protein [Actinocrispum wychmicini]
MDPFDDLLRGVRADGVRFGRTELSPPWTLRFDDEASLTMLTPLRGEALLTHGGDEKPVQVGDTVIARGPSPIVVTDKPGAAPDDRAVLLVGSYQLRGKVAQRLLGVLPPVLVVPCAEDCTPLLAFLDSHVAAAPSGQAQDRLLDWLVVCTLRTWFDQPEVVAPGWLHALSDDAIGPVLRAMHTAPDKPWTLVTLAREAGVSRTTLAHRFGKLVGEPPLTYLTDWRMTLAADLLTESAATIATVARQVGYADAFGFSAAFKRFHGMSPSEYRDHVAVCSTA